MKVGDQRVETTKLMARPEVEGGLARKGPDGPVERGRLQNPCRGRAHSDDTPALATSLFQRGGRRRGQFGPLGVKDMVLDPRGLDGAERAEADMQCDVDHVDATGGEASEEVIREVEPAVGAATAPGARA